MIVLYHMSLTDKVVLPRVLEYEAQLLQDNDQIMSTLKNSENIALCAIDASGSLVWQNVRFSQLQEGGSGRHARH